MIYIRRSSSVTAAAGDGPTTNHANLKAVAVVQSILNRSGVVILLIAHAAVVVLLVAVAFSVAQRMSSVTRLIRAVTEILAASCEPVHVHP